MDIYLTSVLLLFSMTQTISYVVMNTFPSYDWFPIDFITFSALGFEKPICVNVSSGDKFCLWILVGVGFFLGGKIAAMVQFFFRCGFLFNLLLDLK